MELAGWVVAIAAMLIAGAAVVLRRDRSASPSSGSERTPRSAGSGAGLEGAAFSALPIPALVVNGEARVLAMSAAAVREFPFVAPGGDLLSAFGELALAQRASEVARDGGAARFEVRLFVDRRRTFHVTAAAVGPGTAVVCMADATEAADYQGLRMQFVANVSHELRTPLTGLKGLLEALDDPDLPDELRRRFAARAQAEADRLSAIMEDVLLLSELETSSRPFTDQPIDIAGPAGAAVEALGDAAREGGVEIVTDFAPDLLTPVTPRIAEILVTNLVTNAIRYAGPGSTARVRTLRDGEDLVLEVADDGVGIGEEHLPHVFERFYRVEGSRSSQVGGTGLGLAIVKHIAERAGGEVGATSRPGYGTTIVVRLPLARPTDPPSAAAPT
jgi:two-component system phosphate regulon sensor histidine kinase PhoR